MKASQQPHITVANMQPHPSIHPSIHHLPLVRGPCCRGSSFNRNPDVPVPGHFLQLFRGDPKAFPGQPRDIVSTTCPGSSPGSPPSGTCPEHFTREASRGHLTRCPSHLIWLLSMRRSSGSTPSPSRMTELFTLSLRESPDILRRKPISAACIRDLVLSVTTHNS